MEIQDRRENGQFAPKGTGDRTGGKVENASKPKFVNGVPAHIAEADKKYKPLVERMEKEWDDLYEKFYYAKSPEKEELGKKLDELEAKIDKTIEEWEGKHGSLESGLKKGLGLDDKVEDWEISEAVNDMEYYISKDETIGEVAEKVAKKLNVSKLRVVQVMTKEMDADANTKYWDAVDLWNEKNNK